MKKRRFLISTAAAVVLVCSATAIVVASRQDRDEYRSVVFRSGNGWGYDIFHGQDKIISQPVVPGIPGNIPFPDRKTARTMAETVTGKLSRGEYPGLDIREAERILGRNGKYMTGTCIHREQ